MGPRRYVIWCCSVLEGSEVESALMVPLVMGLGLLMSGFTILGLAVLQGSKKLKDASWRQLSTLFGGRPVRHFGKNSPSDPVTESPTSGGRYRRLQQSSRGLSLSEENPAPVHVHRGHASNGDLYDDIFEWQPQQESHRNVHPLGNTASS